MQLRHCRYGAGRGVSFLVQPLQLTTLETLFSRKNVTCLSQWIKQSLAAELTCLKRGRKNPILLAQQIVTVHRCPKENGGKDLILIFLNAGTCATMMRLSPYQPLWTDVKHRTKSIANPRRRKHRIKYLEQPPILTLLKIEQSACHLRIKHKGFCAAVGWAVEIWDGCGCPGSTAGHMLVAL